MKTGECILIASFHFCSAVFPSVNPKLSDFLSRLIALDVVSWEEGGLFHLPFARRQKEK